MADLLGLNQSRPAPVARVVVAVDWNAWHLQLVLYEEYEQQAAKERAVGTLDLPAPCTRSMRRVGGGPEVRTRDRDQDPALKLARQILVEQRVVTAAASRTMTPGEVRAAMDDLQRRQEARKQLDVKEDDTP